SAVDRARREQDSPRPGQAEDTVPDMQTLAHVYRQEGQGDGLELQHQDHAAHPCVQHQIGIVQADIRSGFFSGVASMELVGDNIQVCRDHDGGCAAFRDFVFVDGLVADFQVNGNPLGENFFPGSAEKSRNGVSVSVISSNYSFALDVLSVLLDVETDSDTEVTATDSWYVGQGAFFILFLGAEARARHERSRRRGGGSSVGGAGCATAWAGRSPVHRARAAERVRSRCPSSTAAVPGL